jgi:hypothetical protein
MAPFADLIANDASRNRLYAELMNVLSSAMRPVIVVIEDMHRADESTLDLLVYIARRMTETNAMLLVTFRDDEVNLDHPLRLVLGNVASLPAIRRLKLARLTKQAVGSLAAGCDVDVEHLFRVTAGNPFFVTELLRVPAYTVPEAVRDVVLARAAGLSKPARSVLEAVSVIPDQAEIGLVNAIAGPAADRLGECEEVGMLCGDGRVVYFRHDLARRAVEQAIPSTRAPVLHGRALAYLAEQPATELARLVYHAGQAGDGAAVVRFGPDAAREAAALGAHKSAADHYRLVLRQASIIEPWAHADLLEQGVPNSKLRPAFQPDQLTGPLPAGIDLRPHLAFDDAGCIRGDCDAVAARRPRPGSSRILASCWWSDGARRTGLVTRLVPVPFEVLGHNGRDQAETRNPTHRRRRRTNRVGRDSMVSRRPQPFVENCPPVSGAAATTPSAPPASAPSGRSLTTRRLTVSSPSASVPRAIAFNTISCSSSGISTLSG